MSDEELKERAEKYALENRSHIHEGSYEDIYEAYMEGAKSILEGHGWVSVSDMIAILDKARIEAVKSNSHKGDYCEQVLYNVIQDIHDLPTPPQK